MPPFPAPPAIPGRRPPRPHRQIIQLIWLYFWLLIFEGVLRKWVLPGLAGPLLLVRDPVAAGILFLAYQNGVKLQRGVLMFFLGTGVLFSFLGLIQMAAGSINPKVFVFGMRTYFLHFPVLFVMGEVLSHQEVRRFVRPILLLSIPMTLLMVYQFNSGSDARINVGAGEGARQLEATGDRIRAAGTFSFISGPIAFYSLVLACSFYELLTARKGRWSIAHVAFAASVMVGATAGSRQLVISLGIVAAMVGVCVLIRPQAIAGGMKIILVGGLSLAVLSTTSTFQAGLEMMTDRTLGVAASEGRGVAEGLFVRIWNDLIAPIWAGTQVPIYGAGIGLGTNVGSSLSVGYVTYLLAEGEWARVVMEAGIIGGLLYIGFRVWAIVMLFLRGIAAAQRQDFLPLLLFGAGAPLILNGQWGQTTTLGFATFIGGLAFAASKPQLISGPRAPQRLVAIRVTRSRNSVHR